MIYTIQHKIHTLAENAVNLTKSVEPFFELEGIRFTHWTFSPGPGWQDDAWLAEGKIEATSGVEAYNLFRDKLVRIIPRVAFISQCYTEFGYQPFLITKDGSDVGYFAYVFDSDSVGLMFEEKELEALTLLMQPGLVSEEFFLYWNDAVNTTGYSPKLLVLFSALEALAKLPSGKKDFVKLRAILKDGLYDELFARNTGLRHRLTHGEHFSAQDFDKNYVEVIHNSVVSYFNDNIFKKQLMPTDVTEPHRHPLWNKMSANRFIRLKDATKKLNLKDALNAFNASQDFTPNGYEYVYEDAATKDF